MLIYFYTHTSKIMPTVNAVDFISHYDIEIQNLIRIVALQSVFFPPMTGLKNVLVQG